MPEEEIKPIEITTGTADVIDKSNAILHGWINNIGDIRLAQYGICCSTDPDLLEQTVIKANNIDKAGLYSISLSGLQPGIHYYKAYMVIGNKNYYGEIKTFTIEKEGDSDGSIVGVWELTKEVRYYVGIDFPPYTIMPSIRRFKIFKADGSYDEWDMDAAAWWYGSYSASSNRIIIHYIDGDVAHLEIIFLTAGELIVEPYVKQEPEEAYYYHRTFLRRVTDQELIDRINYETQNNPAKQGGAQFKKKAQRQFFGESSVKIMRR